MQAIGSIIVGPTGLVPLRPARIANALVLFAGRRLLLLLALAACKSSPPDCPHPLDAGAGDAETADTAPAGAESRLPQLPPNLGHVMAPLRLVTIVASNDDSAAQLHAYSDALMASPWFGQVAAEYHAGPISESLHFSGPAITTRFSHNDFVSYIQSATTARSIEPPNGNTLYLVYLPQGLTFADSTACGYHASYPTYARTIGDGFAVVRRCPRRSPTQTELQMLEEVASHEIIEAATDPTSRSYHVGPTPDVPWKGSVFEAYGEVGHVEVADLCEGTRYLEGANEYQRSWSNLAASAGGDACHPALSIPYYNLKTELDWYQGQPGAAVSIPLVGWSSAQTDPWLVNPHRINWTGAFGPSTFGLWRASSELGPMSGGPTCNAFPAANNAMGVTVTVSIPQTAHSGDYIVLSIHSFREDTTCAIPAGEDFFHQAIVGVYVP